MFTKSKTFLAGLLLAAGLAASAQAATIIANGDGTSPASGDCTFACVVRYQQVYQSSLFSEAATITALDFIAADAGTFGDGTFQITLSTTSAAVNGLNSVFDTNTGADASIFDTLMFAGTYAIGDTYGFTGAFDYDPTQGNLLVDILRISGSSGGPDAVFNSGTATDGHYSRVYSFNDTANGFANSNYGNHTVFTTADEVVEVPAVPLPAALPMLGFALAGLGYAGRRRIAR